jgi:hypothetical protein
MHILPFARVRHHISVTIKVNDAERIYWARLLSFAHEWRIRKVHYGYANAWINASVVLLDNLLLYAGLSVKSWLMKKDPARELERTDRKMRFKVAFKILRTSGKTVGEINQQAKRYFNGGVMPEYPPVAQS